MRNIVATILLLSVTAPVAGDGPIELVVIVEGGKPGKGQVFASLFDSKESYMKRPVSDEAAPVGADGRARLVLTAPAAGEYAVSVYYDEDGDGELDTNFLGIPKEKVGFSNDARPRFGPAPYDKARFTLTPDDAEITIHLDAAKRGDS